MPWIAPAIIGSSLISGYLGNKAASKGADAQQAATQASIEEQRRQFNALMERTQPFTDAQMSATNSLLAMEGLPLMSTGGGSRMQGQQSVSRPGSPTPGMRNDMNPPSGGTPSQGRFMGMNSAYAPATRGGGPASAGASNQVFFSNYGIAPPTPSVMGWPGGPSAPGGPAGGNPYNFLLEPAPYTMNA